MTKGFTLIELLIVVAIIAILAAIAVPNFLEAQTRSKVSRCKADQRSMATALEAYCVDYNTYPPHYQMPPNSTLAWPARAAINADGSLPRVTTPVSYMTTIPKDPFAANTLVTPGPGIPGSGTYYRSEYFMYLGYNTFSKDYGNPAYPDLRAYAVTSFGPNKMDDAMGWRMYNWFTNPNSTYYQTEALAGTYDPTNGTISTGDIGRFGGAVPPQAGVVTNTK